ncbi:MAG: caspase family protein [Microscillaceae bacterium]|nr:caspase family protein [Microscillaceae bacterium]
MPKKLYALLVGINEYPQLSPLKGCVRDIEELEAMLLQKYAHLKPAIKCLKNAEATRDQVIQNFREHLGKAQNGDTVFFHFSGHGSRENSPPEFWAIHPDKKNETLVCYDSRYPERLDLADFELAVLLWEISQNKPNVDIVISLDCCHSGSGTRDTDDFRFARTRQAEREGNSRSLQDCIKIPGTTESYYEKNYRENQGKIQIPITKHILLAACDKTQKAWETLHNQGIYTAALLEVLRKSTAELSYTSLFREIRILVHRLADFQDPQLENYAGFDAFGSFLEGKTLDNSPIQHIYFKEGNWQIDLGAIHGLNPLIRPEETVQLKVFPSQADITDSEQCLGLAKVLAVKPQKSLLELEMNAPNPAEIYQGVFTYLPMNPIRVYLTGEEIGKTALQDLIQNADFYFVEQVNEIQDADFEIKAQEDVYYITQRPSGKLIQGIQNRSLIGQKYPLDMGLELIRLLEHLAQWQNFSKLHNPRPKLNPQDIAFDFYEIDKNDIEYLHSQEDVHLVSYLENEKWQPIDYRVEVRNNTHQSLYFQMFFINNRYGIYWANTKQIASGQRFPLMYHDKAKDIIGFHPTLDRETEIDLKIKLIVSTEAIDAHLFELKSLEIGKILNDKFLEAEGITKEAFVSVQEDWFTKEVRIKVVKNLAQISDRFSSLAEGKISIAGHNSLKAQLSLKSFQPQTRNAGEMSILSEIPGEEITCLNFAPQSRSANSESILELSEIEGDISPDNPLYIHLNTQITEDEQVIPLALEDGLITPVGWAEQIEPGKVQVILEHLPSVPDDRRRSIRRSLQLLFFKIALGKQGKENARLSHLYLNDQGKVVQDDKNLKEKIQKLLAEKEHIRILLMIHGIIGSNPNNFLKLGSIQKSLNYDLILGFDYENLNTPLEDTAKNLKTLLREAGLDQSTNKSQVEIDLLVHSMGGLVARKYIEEGSGDQLISRLIMMGTPNGGSVFGGIPAYIEFATKALILALNYLNPYIGSTVGLLWLLQKNKDLAITQTVFKTLSQMESRSAFIEGLNNNGDPKIPYIVVAGDASINDSKGVLTQLKRRLGNIALDEPNDAVVSQKSMESIGSKTDQEIIQIACHHLAYFTDSDSLELLKRLLHAKEG